MFKNMKLGTKLIVAFLAVGVIPFAVIGVISLTNSSNALEKQSFAQLESLRDIKKNAVKRYIHTVMDQMITFSENRMIIEAMQQFDSAFDSFMAENGITSDDLRSMRQKLFTYYRNDFSEEYRKQNDGNSPDVNRSFEQLDDESIAFQHYYIKANGHPLGSKDQLDSASDKSKYSQLHSKYHPIIRSYLKKFGYYDIFLVDQISGDIVYSVFKELDYTTSLIDGPYAQTNFGKAFRRANAAQNKDAVIVVDFAQYFPSYEAPAGFVASPVYDGNHKVGVVIFQFPIDVLNGIMRERAGMGETGETYLVGSDKLMRSDSYLDPEHHSVAASFRYPEKGKVDTLAATEALSGKTDEKIVVDYNGNPVLSAFTPLKIGDTTWALLAEIDEAEAFAAVETLKWLIVIIAIVGITGIIALSLLITRSITKPLLKVSDTLWNSSTQIASASTQLSSSSQEIANGATEQASSIEETTSSMEELASMVKQNVSNAQEASNLAEKASEDSQEGHSQMEKMLESMTEINKSSGQISKIIKVIDDIAFQTNILALNAAVEAARAGEAGMGFAVVADEVKNLANRSAEAAKETSAMIEDSIKRTESGLDIANKLAEVFKEILNNIQKVAEMAKEVETASKQQDSGINQVNKAIVQFDEVVQGNVSSANETASSAEEMLAQVETLNDIVKDLVLLVTGKENGKGEIDTKYIEHTLSPE